MILPQEVGLHHPGGEGHGSVLNADLRLLTIATTALMLP
jgi:hypothetical protein